MPILRETEWSLRLDLAICYIKRWRIRTKLHGDESYFLDCVEMWSYIIPLDHLLHFARDHAIFAFQSEADMLELAAMPSDPMPTDSIAIP